MAEDKTIIMPDNQNGWGNIPFAMTLPLLGGLGYGGYGYGLGGGLLGGGFGAGILGGILGGLIPNFFGWGGGNWGGGNGMGAAAASLGAQATANNNAETILRAIDGTDADVRLLATTLNTDVNTVKTNLCAVQNALTQLSGQTGLSAQQIINSIQAGNMSLGQQLCQCCCEMRQLTVEQGYQNQIATLQQTNTLMGGNQKIVDAIADLKATTIKEFCDAKERDMAEKIEQQGNLITQLRGQLDNDRQTAQFSAMLAPIAREVDAIRCNQPNTIPVIYPNVAAVNQTPSCGCNGGCSGNQFGWGGFNF